MCHGWADRSEEECHSLWDEEKEYFRTCSDCDFYAWDEARGGYYPANDEER